MRVAFYAPFGARASDPAPTFDSVQARAVLEAVAEHEHEVRVVSQFRARLFWLRRHRLRKLPRSIVSAHRLASDFAPEVWFTFGTERDAQDVFGLALSRRLRVPYLIYKAPAKHLSGPARPGRPGLAG